MTGIKVGNGAIIGARSVVAKEVAPYSIVGGNPAKEIRKRFSNDFINLLQIIKWWDWPAERITSHLEVLTSNNELALREAIEDKM